ncbi:MAG: hypothetical protein NMNS01_16640 [Nitrosomonas sp.]|nr:MAG: hypothetical protein NMNS01_16640 [Nitrosomonas sp.]
MFMIEVSIAGQTGFAAMDYVFMNTFIPECPFGKQLLLHFMNGKKWQNMMLADFGNQEK